MTPYQKRLLSLRHRQHAIGLYFKCLEDVLELCDEMGLKYNEIIGRKQKARYLENRIKVTKLLKSYGYTYSQIGFALSRHHTSIRNLCDDVYREKKTQYTRKYVNEMR
jgi:hypothetical protein